MIAITSFSESDPKYLIPLFLFVYLPHARCGIVATIPALQQPSCRMMFVALTYIGRTGNE